MSKPDSNKRSPRGLRAKFSSALRTLIRYVLILSGVVLVLLSILVVLYRFDFAKPPSTLMVARYMVGERVERNWVSLDDVNPVLVHSVMMSEDGKFCSHYGVDFGALNEVIDNALEGGRSRGASTLSMQTVKNLFLWHGRSYIRKGLELPLAFLTDAFWGKRRMIELYLNVAEWDEGVFGIEAAAKHYFRRSADKLNARQSALLAVTLPNPKRRNPAKPTRSLNKMAARIQKRAYQSGAYIKCLEKPDKN